MNISRLLRFSFIALLLLGTAVQSVQAERRTTYYHMDALGSVTAASNDAGALLWKKSYAPYGEQLDSTTENEKLAYTGKEHDDVTGLTYFGARYYDPHLGRFMSIDPAGVDFANPFTFNRFSYANSNPYRFIDPDGRQVADTSCEEVCREQQARQERAAPFAQVAQKASEVGDIVEQEATSPWNFVPVSRALKVIEKAVDKISPKRIYSARELIRRAEDPGPFHNFPESFNDEIFAGTRTVVKDDYVLYTKRGTLTKPGKEVKDAAGNITRTPARVIEGTYEIGVRPSASGRNEVIMHRMFRPDE